MNHQPSFKFNINNLSGEQRLDIFLSQKLNCTRSKIQQSLHQGLIYHNQKLAKASQKLKNGDVVSGTLVQAELLKYSAEEISLDIIYEDEDILVINKAAVMVVHPAPGHASGTLVNAILHHLKNTSMISTSQEVCRPGIVHRLDKGTSGVMVVAKNEASLLQLQAQFKNRSIEKIYHALAWGKFKQLNGKIKTILGRSTHDRKKISPQTRSGREAITEYKVLQQYGPIAYVELHPYTGRTHQLRAHLKYINHSIIGDTAYGGAVGKNFALPNELRDLLKKVSFQLLHAYSLTLQHPKSQERMTFVAPLREEMKAVLELCRLSVNV